MQSYLICGIFSPRYGVMSQGLQSRRHDLEDKNIFVPSRSPGTSHVVGRRVCGMNTHASVLAFQPRLVITRPVREPSVDNETCLLLQQPSLRITHLVRQGPRTYANGSTTPCYLSPTFLPNSELCRSANETRCAGGLCWR